MQIRTVGVLGCGLMGSGIAQVSAAAGYKTIVGRRLSRRLKDIPPDFRALLAHELVAGDVVLHRLTQAQADVQNQIIAGQEEQLEAIALERLIDNRLQASLAQGDERRHDR